MNENRWNFSTLPRPLTKFDVCPLCGRPPVKHGYNPLEPGVLICPSDPAESVDAWKRRVVREEEELRQFEARALRTETRRAQAKPQAPLLRTGDRSYFDE